MPEKITCPKCGSDQLMPHKKGFSGKKAVAGALITGGVGILAGTIGSNKIKITCLACGHTFKPGEKPKQVLTEKEKISGNAGVGFILMLLFGIITIVCISNKGIISSIVFATLTIVFFIMWRVYKRKYQLLIQSKN
jgi:hypothetical protein